MATWVTLGCYSDQSEYSVLAAKLSNEGIAWRAHHEPHVGGKRGTFFFQVPKPDLDRACKALGIPVPTPYKHTPLSGLGQLLHNAFIRIYPFREPTTGSAKNGRLLMWLLVGAMIVIGVLLL